MSSSDYTLLFFDWDDSVAQVHTLRATARHDALRMAQVMGLSRPRLAGYQLWHQGQRIATTFPEMDRQSLRAPLRLIA